MTESMDNSIWCKNDYFILLVLSKLTCAITKCSFQTMISFIKDTVTASIPNRLCDALYFSPLLFAEL